MNKQEFESRIKSNVSDSLFEEWNRVYMAAGEEIDKDKFCSAIKAAGKGNTDLFDLLISLRNQVEQKDIKIQNRDHDVEMLRNEKNDLTDLISDLRCANTSLDKELKEATLHRNRLVLTLLERGLDKEAIDIVGHGYVIATKAGAGIAFTSKDLYYINEVFSKKQVNP